MILLDANLLLYAYDATSSHHSVAREWLQRVITAQRPVRLSWPVILAFLRITTNFRAVATPLTEGEASGIISAILEQPAVSILQPGSQHWAILSRLLNETGARGPLVMDAHLAALAIEYGATVYTHDRDFARFPGLRVEYPLLNQKG